MPGLFVIRISKLAKAPLRLDLKVQSRSCLGRIKEKERALLAKTTALSISLWLVPWQEGCVCGGILEDNTWQGM